MVSHKITTVGRLLTWNAIWFLPRMAISYDAWSPLLKSIMSPRYITGFTSTVRERHRFLIAPQTISIAVDRHTAWYTVASVRLRIVGISYFLPRCQQCVSYYSPPTLNSSIVSYSSPAVIGSSDETWWVEIISTRQREWRVPPATAEANVNDTITTIYKCRLWWILSWCNQRVWGLWIYPAPASQLSL